MDIPIISSQSDNILNKEFWDSLQNEILNSNRIFTKEDLLAFIEQDFMFSMFFRGVSHKELVSLRSLLNIKDLGYIILLELIPGDKTNTIDFDMDELKLYYTLKNALPDNTCKTIGPLISNRISVLISNGSDFAPNHTSSYDCIKAAASLIDAIHKEYHIQVIAGIGSIQSIHTIYTSFLEALSCMHHCNPGDIIHIEELDHLEPHFHFEYKEAEKHMIDAIRLRKVEAYDYFGLMMNRIRQLNDTAKRNKIIEALVLASHAAQIDGQDEADYFNYTCHISSLIELKGEQLIEWAFQKFMNITGFVKPQTSIDYSNKIVQATKEYLEAHYAEDISLEDVAMQVNISPQYFSKLIKKNTGFNFIDWVSMLRVKKARELLTNSNLTVKEVCFMVGYKDPNYFSRIFKKKIGITPSEYIKNKNFLNNMV